ncbi:hypothetical protein F5X97DRAFT_338340 [Nemania serpens]|nr:hypothetical protein F5X97DRAFT_338340 [Nemania serpens]
MSSEAGKRPRSIAFQPEASKVKAKKKHAKTVSTSDSSPIVDLKLAVYISESGNYYHWAFSTLARGAWTIFEVTQEREDGPFIRQKRDVDPLRSTRCLHPLVSLGRLDIGWWDTLVESIAGIPVPGEGASWNCQDYVIEIWEMMYIKGMIAPYTYGRGQAKMMPYYGPDCCEEQDSNSNEADNDDEDYGDRDDEDEKRQALSAEFVEDSSESSE